MSHHFPCPDCGADLRIRTSGQLAQTVRRLSYQCMNPECGACFSALVEIAARLNMPSQPSRTVLIPLSRHVDRQRQKDVLALSPEDRSYVPRTLPIPNGDLFAESAPS